MSAGEIAVTLLSVALVVLAFVIGHIVSDRK